VVFPQCPASIGMAAESKWLMEHSDILTNFLEIQEVGWSVVLGLENAIMDPEVSPELRDRIQSLADELARALERNAEAIEALRQIDRS